MGYRLQGGMKGPREMGSGVNCWVYCLAGGVFLGWWSCLCEPWHAVVGSSVEEGRLRCPTRVQGTEPEREQVVSTVVRLGCGGLAAKPASLAMANTQARPLGSQVTDTTPGQARLHSNCPMYCNAKRGASMLYMQADAYQGPFPLPVFVALSLSLSPHPSPSLWTILRIAGRRLTSAAQLIGCKRVWCEGWQACATPILLLAQLRYYCGLLAATCFCCCIVPTAVASRGSCGSCGMVGKG